MIDISPIMSVSFNEEVNTENSLKLLPFVPAIGSCLADFREDSENLDLLTLFKNKEKEKKLAKLAQTLPIVFGVIALLIASVFLYLQYADKKEKIDNLSMEKKSIETQIEANQTKIMSLTSHSSGNKIKLCKESMKILEPIVSRKFILSNLFIRVMGLRTKGMKINDILIRNKEEAEQIALKTENNELDNNGGYEKEITSPYISQLSNEINEDQIKENIGGNIAIIHGYAETQEQVSKFSENLNSNLRDKNGNVVPKTIKRYISINMRKAQNRKIEFLLKGEL